MSIKTRLFKLEAERAKKDEDSLLVLSVKHGEPADKALASWLKETGKPEPAHVVFITKFSSECISED